jgi:hypothetical protein
MLYFCEKRPKSAKKHLIKINNALRFPKLNKWRKYKQIASLYSLEFSMMSAR